MKSNPVSIEIIHEKEKISYLRNKDKVQAKPIAAMGSREREQKEKTGRKLVKVGMRMDVRI